MIVDLLEVRRRAFADLAGGERTSEADIVRFRERGPGSVLARTTEGEAVGAASWQAIQLGVTEIVAVGVLPEYRRQGIAGAVTSAAAGDAFAHGAEIAFLTPGGDEAARVYERAGFRPVVRCLHMSRR